MGSPATRLDRLVSLLDIGSNQSIRSTAAVQLGQIAALRIRGAGTTNDAPTKAEDEHEEYGAPNSSAPAYRGVLGEWDGIISLLTRVVPLLLSKSWETRNAAGQAIYQICHAAGVWDPDGTDTAPGAVEETPCDGLHFADFNLAQTLAAGTKLLASAGKEYDVPELLSKERLQHAKKNLLGKLGLGFGAEDVDVGVDMDVELQMAAPKEEAKAEPEFEPEPEPEPEGRALSARERNQLKRRRKNEAKQGTPRTASNPVLKNVQPGKRHKSDPDAPETPASSGDTASLQAKPGEWPFRALTELLSVELFSPTWESRHGAALGLREIFRTQGSGGGKKMGESLDTNTNLHHAWAEDLAVRLLCVFALDRLGDFVFDQVVAPVRETASQTLAQLLPHISEDLVHATHNVLLEMIRQDSVREANLVGNGQRNGYIWEVRHAGLLGLKYEVAVRFDLLRNDAEKHSVADGMVADVVDVVMLGLRDDDDDIVEQHLDLVLRLLEQLWACISDMKDDLSSSTGGVMDLLSSLYSYPQVLALAQRGAGAVQLTALIPKLFVFFRHTITSVRLAVLHAINAFLQADAFDHSWLDDRLVRLLFQNMIVEERAPIRETTWEVWEQVLKILSVDPAHFANVVLLHIPTLFKIVMMPIGAPIDYALFYVPARTGAGARIEHDIDKGILSQDLTLVGVDTVIRGRLGAATALGEVLAKLQNAEEGACALLHTYLGSQSALQKCLSAVVVQRWAELEANPPQFLEEHARMKELHGMLLTLLDASTPLTYSEMAVMVQRMQHDCQTLLNMFVRDGKLARDKVPAVPALSIDAIQTFCASTYPTLEASLGAKSREKALPHLQEQRTKILRAVQRYQTTKETQDILVFSAVATAVIAWQVLPAKLNPVIRSVMNSVKYEENKDLQARSAAAIADFIALCGRSAIKVNPSGKIVKNLCAFVCQDTSNTPVYSTAKTAGDRIYTLATLQPPTKAKGKLSEVEEDASLELGKLIRRGANMALMNTCTKFGASLWQVVPALWACSAKPLFDTFSDTHTAAQIPGCDDLGQAVLDACSVLEAIVPHVDCALYPDLIPLLSILVLVITSPVAVIRAAGARCFAALSRSVMEPSMHTLVEEIVPMLGDASSLVHRQGAIEAISQTVRGLDDRLLPYVIFLVVPVLGRMSDSDQDVRLLATNTFAELVKLVPLVQNLPDPPGFPARLLERRQAEQEFLSQLLDGSKVKPYEVPVEMKAELRKYQLDGVSWMAFLAKYQLHGILCDDMGLGKTLQSITLLSSKHYERDQRWQATHAPDATPTPSLIVCPPTLIGHWVHEIRQYSPNLKPLMYAGYPAERARLQTQISRYDAVIMSYDVVRNDVEALSAFSWFYCILDEGHVISSPKTKTTRAVKRISALHRMILSGTPIQNNVLELWSLFDFLMPGFLGTEYVFHERFAKPVLACRNGKPSAAEQEAATFALEALHKQIVPFLLRRLKEDVLDDLPPKIIQDVECDLGEMQKRLYDDFVRSKAREHVEDALEEEKQDSAPGRQHVFQTLQYLRKLANHPCLVLDKQDSVQAKMLVQINDTRGTLAGLAHAPKLQALRQLLLDCGIGTERETLSLSASDAGVAQHRVLIFCQMRQMLDVIENDLFKNLMKSVSYLRLDGSVSTEKRHGIVQRFNADPSIDALLLTTSVGGLGLTLTGADTVIFVEHDWNPMRDLQAMDRAHRLGQKKVVNVYRLITRNTLESKIMGLQQFKMNVANSVVTQQNKGMELMDTDQILDLFDTQPEAHDDRPGKVKGISQKALLASLENMPDVEEEEYASMTTWTPDV
ncbi:Mot1p [Malassezia vespertilionis]|uniref:Mot1p n=1 Tax=Malassezia vespertilionis TaxID=2020962 RepID=A0A2N1JCB3_9BASI|nr:Mot1p [Malassezia vespertilionis]